MPQPKTAFVFPAFVRDYQDDQSPGITGFPKHFQQLLNQAAQIIDPELLFLDPKEQNFLDHELRTQYIAFIHGCAVADVLEDKGIRPDYISGYSMGIYAALVQGGAVSFEDGLMLIRNAFQEISYTTLTGRFGMAGIIGLNEKDLNFILANFPEVELTNQNSAFSVVLSGRQHHLEKVLELARQEGAFHARMLNVTVPYHSHLLKSAALQFAKFVYTLDVKCLKTPVISVLDQQILHSPEDIKTELVENLYKHFNWLKTQEKMQQLNVTTFIECGPGKNLAKNARFIPGNYVFVTPFSAVNLEK
ncbi:MAG: ACP S-malonyltransferase [bacterium]